MKRKICLFFLAILMTGSAIYFLTLDQPIPSISAATTQVKIGDLIVGIDALGHIIARDQTTLSSQVAGFVNEISVREGQKVSRGDLLFSIDDTAIQFQIQQAQAAYDIQQQAFLLSRMQQADQQAKIAQWTAQSIGAELSAFNQSVRPNAVLSQDEIQLSQQMALQEMQLSQLKEQILALKAQLESYHVYAQADGTVLSVAATMGQAISPGIPVIVMGNTEQAQVSVLVETALASDIKAGLEATIARSEGDKITGRVTAVGPVAASVNQESYAQIYIDPQSLPDSIIGARVQVTIIQQKAQGILVPLDAIIQDEMGECVYQVQDGLTRRIPVRIMLKNDLYAQVIAENLDETSLIVHYPPSHIQEGMRVVKP